MLQPDGAHLGTPPAPRFTVGAEKHPAVLPLGPRPLCHGRHPRSFETVSVVRGSIPWVARVPGLGRQAGCRREGEGTFSLEMGSPSFLQRRFPRSCSVSAGIGVWISTHTTPSLPGQGSGSLPTPTPSLRHSLSFTAPLPSGCLEHLGGLSTSRMVGADTARLPGHLLPLGDLIFGEEPGSRG